ncbi:hypothetical protein [Niabella pedocola]|uniref:hypothetical protein n=1 Tax=Niabella pedocola TaxID=1752077 RepID=UPI00374D5A28
MTFSEIGIDDIGRLFVRPRMQTFDYIYRAAAEVGRDNKEKFLFSPKPREWTYFTWYKHIIQTAKEEYNCKLCLVKETKWTNISDELKQQIKEGH